MCSTKRQHVQFKKYLNKIDSNHNKDYPAAFIDDFLYEAALDYVDMFYNGSNPKGYSLGFEVTQQRIDMLSPLVVPFKYDASVSNDTEFGFNVEEFPLGSKDDPYLHLVRVKAKIEGCNEEINVDLKQHDDLNTVLVDAFKKPSIKWRRSCGVIRKSTDDTVESSLYIYFEGNIEYLRGEYIKLPKKPYFGGYTTLEASEGDSDAPSLGDAPRNMDIPKAYCDLVANMAAQLAAGIVQDYNTANFIEQKVRTTT